MIFMNPLSSKTMHHLLPLLLLALLLGTKPCEGGINPNCTPSSCSDVPGISSPFPLMGDPKGCSDQEYELACGNNRTVLYLNNSRYYVRSITNFPRTFFGFSFGVYGVIRLVYDGLQNDESSSFPHYTLTFSNSSLADTDFQRLFFPPPEIYSKFSVTPVLNCSKPVASPSHIIVDEPCTKTAHNSSFSVSRTNNYYLYGVPNANASDVADFCTMYTTLLAPHVTIEDENYPSSCDRIHNMMMDGFDLSYSYIKSDKSFICFSGLQHVHGPLQGCIYRYYYYHRFFIPALAIEVLFVVAKFVIGAPFVLIFLTWKWRRSHLAMDANVEEFLQANNNFLPIRYSYFNIKKITNNFRHKLGEGGYGSVYRGKLRSGSEVAVKILKKAKSNYQEFISEVATIGRIHHINVVHLIGFCLEGSKQALVYDFMPNGSLNKHIFSKVDGTLLDCEKIYKIALGVARGIEYLHRGCDMQILHFDIKPHNILLDKDFIPKVSDFGLARLYPIGRSIVSLTAARGTLGYMAPELFYKDIGGISYKVDVYSFGMLLMEMASKRRNTDANTKHSSQIYFPLWIYDQLDNRKSMKLEEIMEEERDIAMKMIIVALWCIQLIPNHRPSMKRVINMLEGDTSELQVPPKPLLYPADVMPVVGDGETEIELETFTSSSSAPIIYASLQLENTC